MSVALDQVGEGQRRGVVVVGVVAHDHREGPFEGRRHDVGTACELAAPQMHGLMHGAALEEVVALVRAAPGVEEREHPGDEQRGFVVRDGVGPREDRRGLAVLAVGVGEEERLGGREALVHAAALAHEAPLEGHAVVEGRVLGGDEVVGLDVDADVHAVAEGSVLERRGAVDHHVAPDAHLADEACADQAGVASHLAHLGGALRGMRFDHPLECGDRLRAVAVDGHDVGRLRRHRVVDLHRAASALVHRGHAHAVSEGRGPAAFEGRDALDEHALPEAVVRHARTDDADPGGDFDPPFEPALQQLTGLEILRYGELFPRLGRIAEGFKSGDLRRGQWSESLLFHNLCMQR